VEVRDRLAANEYAKIRRGVEPADSRELLDGDVVLDEIRQLSVRRRSAGK
jgi:hypothetical protein